MSNFPFIIREALQKVPIEDTPPPDSTLPRASVALIFAPGLDTMKLLFIRRSEHPLDPWSGHIGFPGGKSDSMDTDLISTALRETHEEIGFRLVRETELLGPLPEIVARARMKTLPLVLAPFVFWVASDPTPQLSDEVTEIIWISLEDLLSPIHRGYFHYTHGTEMFRLPCLEIRGHRLWGLSLMITQQFLQGLAKTPLIHRLRQSLGILDDQVLPVPLDYKKL